MKSFMYSLVFIALVGCSTPYQELGFTGGVTAVPIADNVFRIQARGNGFTSRTRIENYVLLKAAETTRSVGGTHFVVLSNSDRGKDSVVYTNGSARTTFDGDRAYTTYTPAQRRNIYKPGQDLMIKVINSNELNSVPQGAIEAQQIIKHISPRVRGT